MSIALFCCCSLAHSCPTLYDPMDYSIPGFVVLHYLLEFAQNHDNWVNNAIQPSRPLSPPSSPALSLSASFPMLTLHIRWTKQWSFSFSISHSNEYSGLISFRVDWFDILSPRDSQESSLAPQFKSINSSALSFYDPTPTFMYDYW